MMVPDMINGPIAEVLSQTIELIIEVVISSKNVFIGEKSFSELASYFDRIIPLLKEFNKRNISDSEVVENVIQILNRETRAAQQLIGECSKRNKVYLLINCRSIAKRIEDITKEISDALSRITLASIDVSLGIKEDICKLVENMQAAEFRAAIAEEEILEKIESGIQERNVDRAYANNLLFSIAEAVGIPAERSALRKEVEGFKNEIEDVRLRKNRAEALQMDQIIALLERADATQSHEDKEKRYLAKRKSLGSQPLEPLQSFYCPITKEVMIDPVETPSGHTYERSAIEKWLADEKMCPLTWKPLDVSMLRPNKTLRQSIEEWKDRNTMIIIASLKSKLASEEEEEVLLCLENLQDLSEQREIHREWIVLEDYIPSLSKLLGSKNREIRNRTLVVLSTLAKDSDDVKERIIKVNGAMEFIVRSLGRRITEGKLAVALLLELSKSELARDCIGKVQGCILLLVTMSSNDDEQAARDARDVLENLSFSDDNVILMSKANYFKYLLQRLSSGSDDVKMRMARTLGEMDLTDHNKSLIFEEGVLDSLLCLLSNNETEMQKVAIGALRNLSTLPKNGQEMIRQGAVRPLLDILYRHNSLQSLREAVAATLLLLALSTMAQNSAGQQVSMFESDEDINQLFSLISLTRPPIQQSILQIFHALCHSPSASYVKANLIQCSAVQVLVQLCEVDNKSIRVNALKLFYCLSEVCDESTIMEHVGQKAFDTLLNIIKTSADDGEVTSAMGIISNLPKSSMVSEWLLEAGGFRIIFSFLSGEKHNGSHQNELIENAIGALHHFTVSMNEQSRREVAQAGLIRILVYLLESGTSLMKRQAAIALAQISESSSMLSRPVRRHHGFWCFSNFPESRCPVHLGICTAETSFCLLEAGAVEPLVRILGEQDPATCEASLDALLTLIDGEKLQSGIKILAEANALPSIIKLLSSPSPTLQEKVLRSLERIFRLLEVKQKYGQSAQMPLVDLTQRGNSIMKPLAAKVLAQLNVLNEQSSFF